METIKMCPQCGGGLYKELLLGEKAKLCCMQCEWKSGAINRHQAVETESIQEKRKDWA